MKVFKGFKQDMTCRGFQFEEGKTYEESKADLCNSGFHACEYPLDVFGYYPPADSVYHEVELDGVCDKRESDSKVCGKKIAIGARLSIHRMVELSVQYIHSKIDQTKKQHVMDGDQSAATNTGDQSAATNTGYRSAATNTGDQSAATNTGNWSAAANTGNWSAAKVSGKQSVAIATGYQSKACGALGCWLVLAEWQDGEIVDMQIARVDGEKIKADTWYMLQGGSFVEVEEEK